MREKNNLNVDWRRGRNGAAVLENLYVNQGCRIDLADGLIPQQECCRRYILSQTSRFYVFRNDWAAITKEGERIAQTIEACEKNRGHVGLSHLQEIHSSRIVPDAYVIVYGIQSLGDVVLIGWHDAETSFAAPATAGEDVDLG